jgi:hypothetical protein
MQMNISQQREVTEYFCQLISRLEEMVRREDVAYPEEGFNKIGGLI